MDKQKKVKQFGLFLILFAFFSCSFNHGFPYKTGDQMAMVNEDQNLQQSKLNCNEYTFLQYNEKNYILRSDTYGKYLCEITSYPIKNVTKADFNKLEFGMTIYQVVELIGIPRQYENNSYTKVTLIFETSDKINSYGIEFSREQGLILI